MLTVLLTCSDKETGELLVDNLTLTQSPYVVPQPVDRQWNVL